MCLPVYEEMVNLTDRICWEFVKKEGYIAIWRKPLNNSCYKNRDSRVEPPLCDKDDDPDNVWYSPMFLGSQFFLFMLYRINLYSYHWLFSTF